MSVKIKIRSKLVEVIDLEEIVLSDGEDELLFRVEISESVGHQKITYTAKLFQGFFARLIPVFPVEGNGEIQSFESSDEYLFVECHDVDLSVIRESSKDVAISKSLEMIEIFVSKCCR